MAEEDECVATSPPDGVEPGDAPLRRLLGRAREFAAELAVPLQCASEGEDAQRTHLVGRFDIALAERGEELASLVAAQPAFETGGDRQRFVDRPLRQEPGMDQQEAARSDGADPALGRFGRDLAAVMRRNAPGERAR